MDFHKNINRVDTMYMTLLESGGEDSTALEMGLEEVEEALQKFPAEWEANLRPALRDELADLRAAALRPPKGPAAQKRWLGRVRDFLIRLPG